VNARWSLVLAAVALAGCGEKKPDAPAAPSHVHEHHAPHGGALQALGDEFAHVELVLDAASGRLTAYVLDGEAEKPVRVAQPKLVLKLVDLSGGPTTVELTAVANPLTGETVGDTSQFEGGSDRLKGASTFSGTLETIQARGVQFEAVPIGFPGGNEEKK
jgi:hypothetical protein